MSGVSLFLQLGGETGLARLIDRLYERILADEYLGEYFMGVDIARLKSAQLGFLRNTFGDTDAVYTGAHPRAAHAGQLVTEHAFDMFVDLFIEAAAEMGAEPATQQEVRVALRSMRASVIVEFEPNPAYDYKSKPF